MLVFSKTCVYGIRAVLYVASLEKSEKTKYVSIRTIAEELNISFHFLTKILQILSQHNIMISYRGPNGGVSLARPASEIKLYDVIVAIDGTKLFTECILGLPECGTRKPCPVHAEWSAARANLQQIIENTTLAELSEKVTQLGLRLSDK